MDIVCDPETGPFPLASEISFSCSRPDWACLCKHIGAVFYGIANRQDTSPELRFALRGRIRQSFSAWRAWWETGPPVRMT